MTNSRKTKSQKKAKKVPRLCKGSTKRMAKWAAVASLLEPVLQQEPDQRSAFDIRWIANMLISKKLSGKGTETAILRVNALLEAIGLPIISYDPLLIKDADSGRIANIICGALERIALGTRLSGTLLGRRAFLEKCVSDHRYLNKAAYKGKESLKDLWDREHKAHKDSNKPASELLRGPKQQEVFNVFFKIKTKTTDSGLLANKNQARIEMQADKTPGLHLPDTAVTPATYSNMAHSDTGILTPSRKRGNEQHSLRTNSKRQKVDSAHIVQRDTQSFGVSAITGISSLGLPIIARNVLRLTDMVDLKDFLDNGCVSYGEIFRYFLISYTYHTFGTNGLNTLRNGGGGGEIIKGAAFMQLMAASRMLAHALSQVQEHQA